MHKEWKPFSRQEQFLRVPDSVFEGLYGGAAGGGKSDCLLMLPIAKGFYKHPRFKGLLLRRTFPELEAEIILRSQDWYPLVGAKYNTEKKRWTFPSGAIMQFGHMEYESDCRKYDSAEYNYIAFDELTSFTEFQYTYLAFTRCRTSTPDLPSIVRSGTNPGNIGHTWVRRRFIDPAPYRTIIRDKLTGSKRIFIQSLVTDNPHIDAGYKDRLGLLNEADRRAKRDGDWDTFEGQVFDDFRPKRLPNEPENACHLEDPFIIPDWWTRVLAIDWGFAAKTVALWGALDPQDVCHIYRRFSCERTKIADWATTIKNCSINEHLDRVVMCQSAWQNRGEELLIHEQFTKYSGLTPHRANNDRIAGKTMIQEYLRWTERTITTNPEQFNQEYAMSVLAQKGIERYHEYLLSFKPLEPEYNLPKLRIFDNENCVDLSATIPKCIYAPKDKTTGKPSEDVMEFVGDDDYDALRYLVLEVDTKTQRLGAEAAHREKLDKIVKQLAQTKDQTSYYRKMEHLERTSMIAQGPVRRKSVYGRHR